MEAGANEEKTEHVLSSRSSNLLCRFRGGLPADELAEEDGGGDSDEIDLGLSLGGCFSSADSQKKRMLRSSSIPALLSSELQPVISLSRACSLPSEMEEEIWRRKEMQSMKRMEVKRKMDERRRGGETFEQDLEGGSVVKLRRFDVLNGGSWNMRGGPANTSVSPGISRWISGAEVTLPWASPKAAPPASQGSIASQGSSSSQGSELESRPGGPRQSFEISGYSHGSEAPAMAERGNHKASSFSPSSSAAPASKPINGSAIGAIGNGAASNETLLRMNGGRRSDGSGMEEMPSVSTRGASPNGRRIEGFLYRYRRGEEVRIVCVCHGSFLTPAEFVKHGGGGDVEHPLKHIVVNASPAFL